MNIYQIISDKTMNRTVFVILSNLIFISLLNAQQKINVLVKVIVHCRPNTSQIYITGNTDNLGFPGNLYIGIRSEDSVNFLFEVLLIHFTEVEPFDQDVRHGAALEDTDEKIRA